MRVAEAMVSLHSNKTTLTKTTRVHTVNTYPIKGEKERGMKRRSCSIGGGGGEEYVGKGRHGEDKEKEIKEESNL